MWLMSSKPHSWAKRPTESDRAYMNFCYYRDMGPGRSIQKAWERARREQGKSPIGVPNGRWTAWTQQHDWKERALAYDASMETALKEAEVRQMERRGITASLGRTPLLAGL
jgi:hypothetical protein